MSCGARRSATLVFALSLTVWSAQPATADEGSSDQARRVSLYDARGVGAVVDFTFFAPQAVFPFPFQGGVLESTSVATSSPRGFGFAGLAPVPAVTSTGILIPEKNPFTGEDVPPEVRDAFKSVDYSQLPTGCQALFPPVKEGGDEVNCGGPNQDNPALAFTYAGFNGYSKATGDLDDPLATRTLSRSRAEDIGLPSLQATVRQAWTQGLTAVNDQGLPQAESNAYLDTLNLAGTLVRIEGVSSHTIVATDGTEAGTAARTALTIRAASVGGIPVVIGPDGVAVDKNQIPQTSSKPLSEQVESLLKAAGGLSIRLLSAPVPRLRGNEATAESASLLISYTSETPTPTQVGYRVGFTKAVVNAVPGVAVDDTAPDGLTTALPAEAAPAASQAGPGLHELPGSGSAASGAEGTAASDDGSWPSGPALTAGDDTRPATASAAAGARSATEAEPAPRRRPAASSAAALGETRLLRPSLTNLRPLPVNGLRRLYSGLVLLAVGGAGLARLRRLSWLQPFEGGNQ